MSLNLTKEQEKLAYEIAYKLGDMRSLQWHRKMVNLYSESYLREQLEYAMTMPDDKVKVSRGAIYNKAIQRNGSIRN